MLPANGSTPPTRRVPRPSDRFLDAVRPFADVVLVTHVNPDPDALASMLGLKALIEARQPGARVTLTLDGIVARAENQAMVKLLGIDLVPVESAIGRPNQAVVMVDTQPHTGRRRSEDCVPTVVLDHHETPGDCSGVAFHDIRPHVGATSTLVTGYLLEQGVTPPPRLATALLYGIESEIAGYPREAGPGDDGAQVWLFPRADKDLLARIRNPRLPQSYFATFHHALDNAALYDEVVVAWCGSVPQPDIVAELADFFIRFDQVSWSLAMGVYDGSLKLSARCDHIGGHCGERLREAVSGLGSAGGHDKRAGGAIPLADTTPEALQALVDTLRRRFLASLRVDETHGRPLLAPATQAQPVGS